MSKNLEGKINKMTRQEDSGKVSTTEDINSRRIIKTRAAKANEDKQEKKGNFIFKAIEASSEPLKTYNIFEKASDTNQTTPVETNSPKGLFKNMPNPFSANPSAGFKNIFDNKDTNPGSLFGNNKPVTGSLFGNADIKPASGSLFGNADIKPATGSLFGNAEKSNTFAAVGTSGGLFGKLN